MKILRVLILITALLLTSAVAVDLSGDSAEIQVTITVLR